MLKKTIAFHEAMINITRQRNNLSLRTSDGKRAKHVRKGTNHKCLSIMLPPRVKRWRFHCSAMITLFNTERRLIKVESRNVPTLRGILKILVD